MPGTTKLSTPELVIFDCDGVLVDSERISGEVLARVLSQSGLPTSTAEALGSYKGLILREVLERAEAKLGGPLPADFVPRFESERAVEFQRRLEPVAGAAEAVRALSAAGIAVCVATQGKPEKVEMTLSLTGLRELFDGDSVFTAYGVPRGKPFPALFLHAAAAMGAGPPQTVVVEDTPIGVRAGIAAGMRVLGYAADADPAVLREAGAEPFGALREVPALLGLPG
jgi:HAD superfamily hydrolase (TIGR01509 family)